MFYEYRLANNEAVQLAQDANHSVSVMADFRASNFIPESALTIFRRSLGGSRFKFDIAVLLFENNFMHRMFEIFNRLYKTKNVVLMMAHNPEEAQKLIEAYHEKSRQQG